MRAISKGIFTTPGPMFPKVLLHSPLSGPALTCVVTVTSVSFSSGTLAWALNYSRSTSASFGKGDIMEQIIREDVWLYLAREYTENQLAMSVVNISSQESLEGAVIEVCVQQDRQYLVSLTNDISNEDSLHIHLLDQVLSRLDSVTLGTSLHNRQPSQSGAGGSG